MKLVIFDLDGTLLDTIADLAAATNFALTQYGLPTHNEGEYKFFVGNGINKLFERAGMCGFHQFDSGGDRFYLYLFR